mgnify:CR=1 FL=1|jgi:DNA-binding protein HU-beta
MTKSEFAKKIKSALNLKNEKDAKDVIDKVAAVIMEALKAGDEVKLGEFGKFMVTERAARKCRNPQTGETMEVPARKAVKFKPTIATKVLFVD